jgi:hypothetical protein
MTDWQTYRSGNPREIWNLQRLARHRAAKLGYRVHRSRRRKGRDNAGQFMLVTRPARLCCWGLDSRQHWRRFSSSWNGSRCNDWASAA